MIRTTHYRDDELTALLAREDQRLDDEAARERRTRELLGLALVRVGDAQSARNIYQIVKGRWPEEV